MAALLEVLLPEVSLEAAHRVPAPLELVGEALLEEPPVPAPSEAVHLELGCLVEHPARALSVAVHPLVDSSVEAAPALLLEVSVQHLEVCLEGDLARAPLVAVPVQVPLAVVRALALRALADSSVPLPEDWSLEAVPAQILSEVVPRLVGCLVEAPPAQALLVAVPLLVEVSSVEALPVQVRSEAVPCFVPRPAASLVEAPLVEDLRPPQVPRRKQALQPAHLGVHSVQGVAVAPGASSQGWDPALASWEAWAAKAACLARQGGSLEDLDPALAN